ncbi:NUDIX domain-containing protein [Mycoplasmatota bacterium WC30]
MKEIHTFDYRSNKKIMKPNRIAGRAVILRGKTLFLIKLEVTNEYKFPGGGLETNESFEDAVIRETLEESGANISKISKCLGYIDQIYPDMYEAGKIFYLRNIYYLCEISDDIGKQRLSKAELKLEFHPEWVNVDKAIEVNENKLILGSDYHWTERELFMFKYIKENLIK